MTTSSACPSTTMGSASTRTAAPPAGHLGLANLRQRAAALGGVMTIDSSPGRGTRLGIRIPLSPEERPR